MKQPSSSRQNELRQVWDKLQDLRHNPAELATIRTFLRKHQDGAIHIKNVKDEVARKPRAEPPRVKTGGIGSFQRGRPGHDRTKIRPERKPKTMRNTAVWPTNAMLVYLLLLAEAASLEDLPEALVMAPRASRGTDVRSKISEFYRERDHKKEAEENEVRRQKQELQDAAERAERIAKETQKARVRFVLHEHAAGRLTFEKVVKKGAKKYDPDQNPRTHRHIRSASIVRKDAHIEEGPRDSLPKRATLRLRLSES
ncbi:hypothetical protein [Novosphingobium taihuense]|uniref:hypothetical protein n=1 Tax=Novosphingobium taihuense TaxID=260085 RepID=UPI0011A60E2B|nr:hypothetical protein [Novosphingobium taihuense]